MNIIDIIILVCFVPALIQGITKGFIPQAVALLSIILGAWLAFRFSEPVGEWLGGYLDLSGAWLRAAAFAVILVAVSLALNLLGKGLEKVLKVAMLGWADTLLGAVLSFLKAFLVVGLLVIVFDALNSKFSLVPQQTIDESVLYGPLKDAVDLVFPYLKEIVMHK